MFEDSIFDDDFSGETEHQEKMSKNWEDGFEQGLMDVKKGFFCRWLGGSDYSEAYFLGYQYGMNGGT